MVQAISENDICSSSCYKPHESLMSRKKLLMHSLLENCCTLTERSIKRSSVNASLYKSLSSVQSISIHKHHPSDRRDCSSVATVTNISTAVPLASLAFKHPLQSVFSLYQFPWADVKPARSDSLF